MNISAAAVAIVSFMGGLLVISKGLEWSVLVVQSATSRQGADRAHRPLFALFPLVLHSGPWTLALAAAGMYWAARSSDPALLWGALAGFGSAAALIVGMYLRVLWRQRNPTGETPLTEERLLSLRRRFFWGNSLFFGVSFAGTFYFFGLTRGFGSIAVCLVLGFLGGWAWSWFMWQGRAAALQVGEKQRRQREERNAV